MKVTVRSETSPITALDEDFWADQWPALADDLRRVVQRRLPPGAQEEVDDVIQHIAEVLLQPRRYPSFGHLRRFAIVVGCNRVWRIYRWRDRDGPLASRLGVARAAEVEDAVIDRLRLQCLQDMIRDLGPVDQEALVGSRVGGRMPGAIKTRRSRLKLRLRQGVESKVGGGVLLPRLRWLLGPVAAGTALVPALVPLIPPPSAGLPPPRSEAVESAAATAPTTAPRIASAHPNLSEAAEIQRPSDERAPGGGKYTGDLDAKGPAGIGAGTGQWEPDPAAGPQPLVCVFGLDPLPPPCIPHPGR